MPLVNRLLCARATGRTEQRSPKNDPSPAMQRPHRRAATLLLSLGLNEEERSDSNRKDDRQEGNQREVAARAAARILPEGILATVADASRDDARAACT